MILFPISKGLGPSLRVCSDSGRSSPNLKLSHICALSSSPRLVCFHFQRSENPTELCNADNVTVFIRLPSGGNVSFFPSELSGLLWFNILCFWALDPACVLRCVGWMTTDVSAIQAAWYPERRSQNSLTKKYEFIYYSGIPFLHFAISSA